MPSETFCKDHAWIKECPNDVVDGAICDLHEAVASHSAKLKKLRASDYKATLACGFKFRSKRDAQQSFEVRPQDWAKKPITNKDGTPGVKTSIFTRLYNRGHAMKSRA